MNLNLSLYVCMKLHLQYGVNVSPVVLDTAECHCVYLCVPTSLPLCVDLVAVHRVAAIQGTEVAFDGQLAVHHRVFGHQVWFVEVVGVLHVCSPQT